ncbi:MAG TPA: diaminopimelate decarboxylase [Dongiaceae bacterium]|nr:diaminopimelate decarboxylase [Dongiaceae bacterium]
MSALAAAPGKPLRFVDPAEFTPQFAWRNFGPRGAQEVFCEGVPLSAIAEKFATPAYVYSRAAITAAFRELDAGLGALPHTLCFAVKSNGNLTILRELARLGSGFDIVSGGELDHLGHLGIPGDRIVFSGVGKSREEIREALRYRSRNGRRGLLLFNIESEAELGVLLEESSRQMNSSGAPSVSIRVNPDVQAGGHPHISTGHHQHKFGLDWAVARQLYIKHKSTKYITWRGLSAHIGSQITQLPPFERALSRLAAFVRELREMGIQLKYLDFGGGLGVRYTDQQPPARPDYARMVARVVRPLGVHLLLEPGRTIIGPAGVLLTRVQYTKTNHSKTFVVVDSGMNDLLRPALYQAVHPITRVSRPAPSAKAKAKSRQTGLAGRVDVVGPVCETGDCFLRNWPLGSVQAGDTLAIWAAGAYGMSQASNYNARCRPAEILVDGKKARVIRRRETSRDLLRGDVLA